MAEHWKSTPNYWCKFCSVYVRDTPFARRTHEATGRHQSGIQRSLKDLHRTRERDERDKARARSEVARLDALVSGAGGSTATSTTATSTTAATPATRPPPGRKERERPPRQEASVEERKRQMAQLAEMGVAIPEAFRGDMALAGDWTVVSSTPAPAAGSSSSLGALAGALRTSRTTAAATGGPGDEAARASRKRTAEDRRREEVEDPEQGAAGAGKKWGSALRTWPGAAGDGERELEALLAGGALGKAEATEEEEDKKVVKEEIDRLADAEEAGAHVQRAIEGQTETTVKTEEGAGGTQKEEGAVVFKKRKRKA